MRPIPPDFPDCIRPLVPPEWNRLFRPLVQDSLALRAHIMGPAATDPTLAAAVRDMLQPPIFAPIPRSLCR